MLPSQIYTWLLQHEPALIVYGCDHTLTVLLVSLQHEADIQQPNNPGLADEIMKHMRSIAAPPKGPDLGNLLRKSAQDFMNAMPGANMNLSTNVDLAKRQILLHLRLAKNARRTATPRMDDMLAFTILKLNIIMSQLDLAIQKQAIQAPVAPPLP